MTALENQIQTSRSSSESVQTFTHHIRELRRRLFFIVATSVIVGSLVYYYHDFFVRLVMEPLHGQKLVYLTPAGGFSFIFMVTFYATMILVLPVILYQIYAFIKPAIPVHTSRLSLKIGLAATLLMAGGASFGYFVAVPAGLDFLNNFAGEYVTPSLTADSYLSFVLGYVLGIGVLFELPLLLLFWHWIHPLTPKGLWNSERFVIVGAFIAAAVLSPSPDALSQTIIAVPIIAVYQLGVIGVLLSIKKAKRQAKLAAEAEIDEIPDDIITSRQQADGDGESEHTPRSQEAVYAIVKEENKKTEPGVSSKKPAPITRPRQSPRPGSIDGIAPRRGVNTRVAVQQRQRIVPPARGRMINDFGPARPSAVDTSP